MSNIDLLINEEKFNEALEIVNQEVTKTTSNPKFDEKKYRKLIEKRIFIKSKLRRPDELILDAIRKERYPEKEQYTLKNGVKIILELKNNFLHSSDAFVNTIRIEENFKRPLRGVLYDLIRCTGSKNLKRQLNINTKYNPGEFILLEHANLIIPTSYHIFYYNKQEDLQLEILKKGIYAVLNDIETKGLKNISFFPLGFDYVMTAPEEKKDQIASELAAHMFDCIINYFDRNKPSSIQTLYMGFVSYQTFYLFNKILSGMLSKSKAEFLLMKVLEEKQKKIIEASLTNDYKYINILKNLSYYLDSKDTILLLGETGVGKSYLAKTIHKLGSYSGVYHNINCSHLNPDNFQSNLFGWPKGAFTGALSDGVGAIETAEGGVLFLDEIGYTNIETQKMLLLFLDTGEYCRFNEQKKRKANVRLIFGTNVNLEQQIEKNLFLPDLYERIANVIVEIPPLRDRNEDIPFIANIFIQNLNQLNNKEIIISPEALESLKSKNWPGNLRQLDTYISVLYNQCLIENKIKITVGLINDKPPRNNLYKSNNNLEKLESILNDYLENWNIVNGDMLANLIEPVLANLYLNNTRFHKRDAKSYVGMDGTSGKESKIEKRVHLYEEVVKKFS